MSKYAVLCGSAPEAFCQKKLEEKYDFLTSAASGSVPEENIIVFPYGITELGLEAVLNEVFDKAAEDDGQILLYFCAKEESDLRTELSDSCMPGVDVIRLGNNEIRKDVITYYSEKLSNLMEIKCQVEYDWDIDFVSEEALGWERVVELGR